MALIVPSISSTFADATRAEGTFGPYVLAQFRDNAKLEWVGRLRAALAVEELKYKHFRSVRHRFRSDASFWKQIENGVGQATVIVIDPQPALTATWCHHLAEGGMPGQDFTDEQVFGQCAVAVVARTPIAYLPQEMMKVVPLQSCRELAQIERFAPKAILARIGGGLRGACIFAARAHATFDVAALRDNEARTTDAFRSPLARLILVEVLSTLRRFDNESAVAAELLNEASDEIAGSLSDELRLPIGRELTAHPLVQELNSESHDHLQAADMAAGWAREIIDSAGPVALGARFECVWLNGMRVK